MIYTVTFNPALDKTVLLKDFQINRVNRISLVRKDPGGKGINISKMLKKFGIDSYAIGFLGLSTGNFIDDSLRNQNIKTDFVFTDVETRTNLKVVDEKNQTYTDINEPGEKISEEKVNELRQKLISNFKKDDIVIFAGKIADGMTEDIVKKWSIECQKQGAKVFVDVEGKTLSLALESKPYLIKPNLEELEGALDKRLRTRDEIIEEVRILIEEGICIVALSLGKYGALFFNKDEAYYSEALNAKVNSTVGAGDSMMAALTYGIYNNMDFKNMIKLAMATSAAKVECLGTLMPNKDNIDKFLNYVKVKKYIKEINMKTRALRMYGANDLRVEEFELPEITDDEILVKVISDSVCMSTYKCAILGTKHKRVPKNINTNPVIMGHEFAGEIIEVGKNHQKDFEPGMKFALQPALNYKGTMWSPGYSYEHFGGNATYAIIPSEVMEVGCLLDYKGEAFFEATLAEPLSCSIGAFNACYHTIPNTYEHVMGTKKDGKLAILAGGGPMGLGAVEYASHGDNPPSLLVVTDLQKDRIDRLKELFPKGKYAKKGIRIEFLHTAPEEDSAIKLLELSPKGYDDVFVYAPVKSLIKVASDIMGNDGCMNFFAGPTDPDFSASINLYDIHYNRTHVLGSTGGNLDDMIEALDLIAQKRINPAIMITHVGSLDSAGETILKLPNIPGGKKIVYNHIDMELTSLQDFRKKGEEDSRFADLADIVDKHDGLWNSEAEQYLLKKW